MMKNKAPEENNDEHQFRNYGTGIITYFRLLENLI